MARYNMVYAGIFAVLVILLSANVYAWEFDNIKSYDITAQEVTLKNSFLGIPTSDIGKVKLETPLVNYVSAGKDVKVAEINITLLQDYPDLIKETKLYDLRNGNKEVSKVLTWKVGHDEYREVNNYITICTPLLVTKGSPPKEDCIEKLNGTKIVKVEVWTDFNQKQITAKQYRVGLFTDVEVNERIDFIPKIAGLFIENWAVWDSSLSTNLLAYYNFTNYNNSINSSVYPLVTATGTPTLTAGKIGTGLNCTLGAVNHTTSYPIFNFENFTSFTMTFWGYATGSGEKYAMSKDDAGANNWYTGYETGLNGRAWGISTTSFRWATNINSTFVMYSISCNATACVYYVNNLRGSTGTRVNMKNSSTTILSICDYPSYSGRWNGMIDEVAFWRGRALTDAEINTLWSNNAGMTYEDIVATPTSSSITRISQSPNDINSNNSVNGVNISYNYFNGTGDTLKNHTLYSKVNNSKSDCFEFANGTLQHCGFNVTSYPVSNISETNFTFFLNDLDVYPATYNYDQDLMESYNKSNYLINAIGEGVKINFLNMTVPYLNYTLGFFEFNMVNNTATAGDLRAYYCNSSYSFGNFASNSNCLLIATIPPSQIANHRHSNISGGDYVVGFTITDNKLNNQIPMTSNGNLILRGATGGWNIRYISNSTRLNSSQTTSNTGAGWSELSGTFDGHVHLFSQNDTLYYYATGINATGSLISSQVSFDKLDVANIPPTSPVVYNPIAQNYLNTQNLIINYTASTSLNGYAISNYTIYLLNETSSINQTIILDNGLNLSYVYNISNLTVGSYKIGVSAKDNLSQVSLIGESAIFTISTPFGVTSTLVYPANITLSAETENKFEFNRNETAGDFGLNSGQLLGFNITIGKNTLIAGDFTPTKISLNYSNNQAGTFTLKIYNVTSTGAVGTELFSNTTSTTMFSGGAVYTTYNLTLRNQTSTTEFISGREYKVILTHSGATGGRLATTTNSGYKGGALEVVSGTTFIGYAGNVNQEAQFEVFGTQSATAISYPVKLNETNINFNSILNLTSAGFVNYTLFVWNSSSGLVYNYTNSTLNVTTLIINTSDLFVLTDGTYNWNVLSCVNTTLGANSCSYSTLNASFIIDTLYPYFTLVSLKNVSTKTLPKGVLINVTTNEDNVDKCWYYTSESATPVYYTCNTQQNISFNTEGLKTITINANDTIGNANSSSYLAYIYYLNDTLSASSVLTAGSIASNNLTINMTNVSLANITAYIIWNGINQGTIAGSLLNNDSLLFNYVYSVPTLSQSQVNYSWYYNISDLSFSYTYNSNGNQAYTIVNFSSNCSGGNIVVLNYTIFDQNTKTIAPVGNLTFETDMLLTSNVNNSINYTFHAVTTNVNPIQICLDPSILTTSSYTLDTTSQYTYTGHVLQYSYFDNFQLSNSSIPQNINLYSLTLADSTSFLFTFQDENYLPVPDVIVEVLRYYIGDGAFIPVESGRTDSLGQTRVHLISEDVIYKFNIYSNGSLIYQSAQYTALCQSVPCTITLTSQNPFTPFPTEWDSINGSTFQVSSNKSTRIVSLNYVNNVPKAVNLSIFKYVDGNVVYINTTQGTGSSGTLTLTVPQSEGNETFFSSVYLNDNFARSDWIDYTTNARDIFGTFGAILGGIAVLTLLLMAVSEGVVFIVVTILAVILIAILKLVDFSAVSIILIICAGGIIIWKLIGRRNR